MTLKHENPGLKPRALNRKKLEGTYIDLHVPTLTHVKIPQSHRLRAQGASGAAGEGGTLLIACSAVEWTDFRVKKF